MVVVLGQVRELGGALAPLPIARVLVAAAQLGDRELDDLGLAWYEIDLYDPVALAGIRETVSTLIASCESLFGLRGFQPFLAARAVEFDHDRVLRGIDVDPANGVIHRLDDRLASARFEEIGGPAVEVDPVDGC